MNTMKVSPTVPVYRSQVKKQRLYVVPTNKNKITHMPFEIKSGEEVKIDAITDTINMIAVLGLGAIIVGCIVALLIHHLGGWGLLAIAALGGVVWGAKGLWREI